MLIQIKFSTKVALALYFCHGFRNVTNKTKVIFEVSCTLSFSLDYDFWFFKQSAINHGI